MYFNYQYILVNIFFFYKQLYNMIIAINLFKSYIFKILLKEYFLINYFLFHVNFAN